MSERLVIHPENPQARLIRLAVQRLRDGAVLVYPTDSCYAIGCRAGERDALERICRIRQLDERHNFTLMCRDIAEMSQYAQVDNIAFRLIRSLAPGPYTFVLPATREVPKRLQHARRRTIGVRVSEHPVVQALLQELGEPLLSCTLHLPGDDLPLVDPDEICERLGRQVDVVIDSGHGGIQPTTVLEWIEGSPRVAREGKGPVPNAA